MIETYLDWAVEDLWAHTQANFSGHLAMMFTFLARHRVNVDEFIRYTGERAAPGWKDCRTAADMMNGVLLNVIANGGTVLESHLDDDQSTASVTRLLNTDVMRFYGVDLELAERCWDKFVPIAQSLNMRFTWRRTQPDRYQVWVTREKRR